MTAEDGMRIEATRHAAGWVAALVVAAVAASLLAGCGGGGSEATSTPKTIELTKVETGTTLDANVGDTVVMHLDANATTGYSWEFTAGDTFTIETNDYVPDPNPSGLAGKGGSQVVKLKVTKAGQSDLTGTYRHQWETPSPDAAPDFTMTIVSK
jgi:predicted secreted protein